MKNSRKKAGYKEKIQFEKDEVTIRSSATEYLTYIASVGDQRDSIEMRYEDENIWLTQKMIEACQKYIQNNWLGIIVRYDDAGADWGCSTEGQISHVLSARESSRPMGWSKLGVHKMTQLRVFTRNGGKVTDLLECQHKKEQKEKRIARQDELVREVKKSHKISGEEIGRKEIPGLERTSMTWKRDMIYGRGA